MPDIDNDDLDDLFRRAAEDYPLRTNSSDWSKIARELDEGENDASFIIPPVYTGEEKNKRRRVLLLLLLLPLLGVGYFLYNSQGSSSIKNIAATSANNTKNNIEQKRATEQNSINTTDNDKIVDEKNNVHKPAIINKVADKKDLKNNNASVDKTSNKKSNKEVLIQDKAVINKRSKNEIKRLNGKKAGHNNSTKNNLAINNVTDKHKKTKSVFEKIFEKNYSSSTENNNLLVETVNNKSAANTDEQRVSGFNIVAVGDKNITSPDINNKNLSSSVASFIKTDSNDANKKKKTAIRKEPAFYAGAIFSPDLSTIKFQKIKGTGYTLGILLGYNISNRIAIETGVYYDYKKYYSEGEYFDSKKAGGLISYVHLLNLTGDCRMIEVPLNFRYNLSATEKIKWLATAGLSTYFMFKEGYTYNYLYYGAPAQKFVSYNNSSRNLCSILNFSAGYEHKLGNIGKVRIEPFVRIPLAGMGTGSLPIMSAGLNLGFVHSF